MRKQAKLNAELQREVAQLQAEVAGARALTGVQAQEAAREAAAARELRTALQAAEQRVRECEAVRRQLHNTILVGPPTRRDPVWR